MILCMRVVVHMFHTPSDLVKIALITIVKSLWQFANVYLKAEQICLLAKADMLLKLFTFKCLNGRFDFVAQNVMMVHMTVRRGK